jgi:D-lactate dehydrogenase (cytochrome)
VAGFSVRARRPLGHGRAAQTDDPDIISAYLDDAAHFGGGHARGVVVPGTEAELADALVTATSALPVGAQSSLTGGATPRGETVISTRRLNRIEVVGPDRVRVGAGVTLEALAAALRASGRFYPPAPTFGGAFVGGTIATNAAGAATFKYGTTRDWVEALTVVLASGDVLDLERGAVRANTDGYFELHLAGGLRRVPAPGYRMPRVPKLSAGYYAAPGMDLVDLFIGSEGTLGIVTAATLRVLPACPAFCLALIPFAGERAALQFAHLLREDARETWRSCSRRGLDVSAIEYMDRRALEIVREDRADVANGVTIPPSAGAALLVLLELPAGTHAEQAFEQIGAARDADPPDSPLLRFCRRLLDANVFDDVEIAVPGDTARAAQLAAIREAVPAGVNQRVGRARQDVDRSIAKIAADVAVPFERIGELLDECRAETTRHGLDLVVWGHASDGNLHPNILPRSAEDMVPGRVAVSAIGRFAIAAGGAPMAEHGVGRNAIKQQLLREMYGAAGLEEMRRVKRALDPQWKLAPGVLFSP